MRRRLFLDWFTKGIVGAVVAPKTIFDMSVQPVNASDVSWPPVTGGPVTFIASRDMRVPLQLRPGGLYGGGVGGGKTAQLIHKSLAEYETWLVKQHIPELFHRDDAFFKSLEEAAKKDPNYRPPQKQLSLFDGVNTVPLIEGDEDDEGWGEDE